MKYNNILITGAFGYLGANLAINLKTNFPNKNIVAFDFSLSSNKRLSDKFELLGIKTITCKRVTSDLLNQFGNFDLLLDCLADSYTYFNENYGIDFNSNLKTIYNLCGKYKTDIILMSSNNIYPVPFINMLPYKDVYTRYICSAEQFSGIPENFTTLGPKSSKGTIYDFNEQLLSDYSKKFSLKYIINRCGNIAGPLDQAISHQNMFSQIIKRYLFNKGNFSDFYQNPKQVKDILHIEDFLSLVTKQIEKLDAVSDKVFNIGGGIQCSLSYIETIEFLNKITNCHKAIEPIENKSNEYCRIFYVNPGELRNNYNWRPVYKPREILEDIMESMS